MRNFLMQRAIPRVVTISQLTDKDLVIHPLWERCNHLVNEEKVRSFTLAKKVVWANTERVVFNSIYHKDEPDPVRLNKNHTDVCKPSKAFRDPFSIVRDVLNP